MSEVPRADQHHRQRRRHACSCRGGRANSTTKAARQSQPADRSVGSGDGGHDGVSGRVVTRHITKTARFCRAVFSCRNSDLLFAVAEAPRPPSGAAGLAVVGCGSGAGSAGAGAAAGGSGGLWLTGAAASGWALTRKLTFSRTVERRRAAALSASWAVSASAGARRLPAERRSRMLRAQAAARSDSGWITGGEGCDE